MRIESLRNLYRRPRELKALDVLQRPETFPGLAPWKEHETRVRFIVFPSFSPISVWALQCHDSLAQVRRVVWDHVADAQLRDTLPDAAPTVYGADAPLPVATAQAILNEMASICLPAFLPISTLGIDGVTFAIEFGGSWRSASFSWWCDPPMEWQPLQRCFDQAVSVFERFLPQSTAHNPRLQTE